MRTKERIVINTAVAVANIVLMFSHLENGRTGWACLSAGIIGWASAWAIVMLLSIGKL